MAVGAMSGVSASSYASQLMAYSLMSGENVGAGKPQQAAQMLQLLQDTVQISDAGRALAARQG